MRACPPQGEVSEQLLRKALEATVVSRRLFSFHAAFLNMVACPPGSSIEQVSAAAAQHMGMCTLLTCGWC
jgi:hypothetical protein